MKTPYRNGTTHVIFEPLDFIAKLAALAPKPRVNLTRFHGVFAPNSQHQVDVTRGKKTKTAQSTDNPLDQDPQERHKAMTWMQRLKRVCSILILISARPVEVESKSLPVLQNVTHLFLHNN